MLTWGKFIKVQSVFILNQMPKLTFKNQSIPLNGTDTNSISVLTPQGFIDSANYEAFEKSLETSFREGNRFQVMDFSKVSYINSTGISAIIRYHGLYAERNGMLVLISVPRTVGLSMHLLGVTSLVPFHKDLESAKKQFSKIIEGTDERSSKTSTWVPESSKRRLYIPLKADDSPISGSNIVLLTPEMTRFTRILSLRYTHLKGNIKVFTDTRKAAESIEQNMPDLVVIDERMDELGDFVTRLKVHPKRSLISLLKIYPKNKAGLEEDLDFKIWENDYLVDPFDIHELFGLIEAELLRVPSDRKVFLQQISMSLKTQRDNLEKANKMADLIIRQALDSEEACTALYAAVKEGLDNAAVHGNGWDSEKQISLNFLVDHEKISLTIEDQGEGFDSDFFLSQIDKDEAFEKAKDKIIQEGRKGGLGILLMSRCTDEMAYSDQGRLLLLEKNIS